MPVEQLPHFEDAEGPELVKEVATGEVAPIFISRGDDPPEEQPTED